jgi:ribonuclease HI
MTGPVAYTDGACLGNPGPGGWGVRILYADGAVQECGGAAPATTNNRMELQGAIEALKIIGAYQEATVVTDSRYVIDGLTRWIHNWRRRGWLTTTNTPVKNQDLWMMLDRLNHAGIRWQHVRGHTGDPNNERVDAMARAFAHGTPPALFCGQAGSSADPVLAITSMPAPDSPPARPSAFLRQPVPATAKAQYVSIVQGVVALDSDWASCAARVHGVSGARYKKVQTAEELAAFCAEHGVTPPGASFGASIA